jgi:hypothetical protein
MVKDSIKILTVKKLFAIYDIINENLLACHKFDKNYDSSKDLELLSLVKNELQLRGENI